MNTDEQWLRKAIRLAEQCPTSETAFSVGAIIVDAEGNEIANGYSRERDPKDHAEEIAISKVDDPTRLVGATIYSSLEPCGQRASRPAPCAQLIINSGISRVVSAWSEPSDFVDQPCGYQVLRDAGVEVDEFPSIATPNYR